jgi:hypothetical protein
VAAGQPLGAGQALPSAAEHPESRLAIHTVDALVALARFARRAPRSRPFRSAVATEALAELEALAEESDR